MGTIRKSEAGFEVPGYDRPQLPAKVLVDDIDKFVIKGHHWFGDTHYPCSYSCAVYPPSHHVD